jgi:hypothetical protein
MSYTCILDEAIIIRDSDQKIVAPCQSSDDPDFVAYETWVISDPANNQPVVYATRP